MDSNFTPIIWPEDIIPPEGTNYEKCEVCIPKSRIIWGEGNPQAPIMVILDNPGEREDKDGREYICGTRQTLQTVIHQAGLKAEDIYLTFLLKCRPLRRYDKEKARSFSKPFLINQIETKQPEFIVLLGDVVVQSILENCEAHVKDLRGNWHEIMGDPSMISYHPLAVRRRLNLMEQYIGDWQLLSQRYYKENHDKQDR